MTKKTQSTEQKILEAARKVFTEKGYEATKTRDIAAEAGINIASLHYYFRSKEKLFEIIISETMGRYSNIIDKELEGDKPLHQKIRRFVEVYLDFIEENPFVPMFVTNESQRDIEKISCMVGGDQCMPVLEKQLEELTAKKVIRPTSIGHFFCDVIGLAVFPYLTKPMLKFKTGIDEKEFKTMMKDRKKRVADMVISYLYFDPPKED